LRNARVPYQDVLVDYPSARVQVLFRDADSFAKGKAAITRRQPQPDLDRHDGRRRAGAATGADAAGDQGSPGLRGSAEHRDPAQPPQQPGTRGLRAAGARQGVDRIEIQLPGLQNSAEVKKILGKTATLEFRMVDETDNPLEAAATGHVPLGAKLYYTREKQPGAAQARSRRHRRPADRRLVPAEHPGRSRGVGGSRQPRRAKMLKNTQENLGHLMAVVFIDRSRERNAEGVDVDRTTEEVINRATIRGVFSNNFSDHRRQSDRGARARAAAARRRPGGALDADPGARHRPELGQDNIDKGVNAMVFGMLAAFVFMAIYYKVFGLIADVVLPPTSCC
jgi:preprotein translocase subunit SecD